MGLLSSRVSRTRLKSSCFRRPGDVAPPDVGRKLPDVKTASFLHSFKRRYCHVAEWRRCRAFAVSSKRAARLNFSPELVSILSRNHRHEISRKYSHDSSRRHLRTRLLCTVETTKDLAPDSGDASLSDTSGVLAAAASKASPVHIEVAKKRGSMSSTMFSAPGEDFLSLCRAQLQLARKVLGLDTSFTVYIRTPESYASGQVDLQPVAVFPEVLEPDLLDIVRLVGASQEPLPERQAEHWLVQQEAIEVPEKKALVLPLSRGSFLVGMLVAERPVSFAEASDSQMEGEETTSGESDTSMWGQVLKDSEIYTEDYVKKRDGGYASSGKGKGKLPGKRGKGNKAKKHSSSQVKVIESPRQIRQRLKSLTKGDTLKGEVREIIDVPQQEVSVIQEKSEERSSSGLEASTSGRIFDWSKLDVSQVKQEPERVKEAVKLTRAQAIGKQLQELFSKGDSGSKQLDSDQQLENDQGADTGTSVHSPNPWEASEDLSTSREEESETVYSEMEREVATEVAKTIAMAAVMDQRTLFLQQASWQRGVRLDGMLEQVRGPLAALRTLGKSLMPITKDGEVSRDVAENIVVQGERMKDVIVQIQDELYPSQGAGNLVHYDRQALPATAGPQTAALLEPAPTQSDDSSSDKLPHRLKPSSDTSKVRRSGEAKTPSVSASGEGAEKVQDRRAEGEAELEDKQDSGPLGASSKRILDTRKQLDRRTVPLKRSEGSDGGGLAVPGGKEVAEKTPVVEQIAPLKDRQKSKERQNSEERQKSKVRQKADEEEASSESKATPRNVSELTEALVKVEQDARTVDVSDVLSQLVNACTPIAQYKQLTLEHISPPPGALPLAAAEPHAIRQVLSIVLDNALRYTQRGGWVRCELVDGSGAGVFMLVEDDGPGMNLMAQAHAFVPATAGVQLAPGRIEEGSVLPAQLESQRQSSGLSIARDLVEKYGGVMRIRSPRVADAPAGHWGTRVEIWLPTAKQEQPSDLSEALACKSGGEVLV